VDDNKSGKLMNHRPADAGDTQSGSLTRPCQIHVDDNQSDSLINSDIQSENLTRHRKSNVDDNKRDKWINHRPSNAGEIQSVSLINHQPTDASDTQSGNLTRHRKSNVNDNKSGKLMNHRPPDAFDTKINNRIVKHPKTETFQQETIVFKKNIIQRHGSTRHVNSESHMFISLALTSISRTSR